VSPDERYRTELGVRLRAVIATMQQANSFVGGWYILEFGIHHPPLSWGYLLVAYLKLPNASEMRFYLRNSDTLYYTVKSEGPIPNQHNTKATPTPTTLTEWVLLLQSLKDEFSRLNYKEHGTDIDTSID